MMQTISAYEIEKEESLEQFVLKHLPLVKKIALYMKRRLPSHIELEDLLQSGLVGLLEARRNFKTDMGATFETYASIRIRGAIVDALRKNSWVNRDVIRKMKLISNAIANIEQREKRHANTEEIIQELNITAEDYFKISQEINMWQVTNLEVVEHSHPEADGEDNPEEITQRDMLKQHLKGVLKELPEREQLVLSLYYVDELTFKEIGEVLELTEARICQLHGQAVARVRAKMKLE